MISRLTAVLLALITILFFSLGSADIFQSDPNSYEGQLIFTCVSEGSPTNLCLLKLATGQIRQLTSFERPHSLWDPEILPDGTVLYVCEQRNSICVMSLDGSNQRKLDISGYVASGFDVNGNGVIVFPCKSASDPVPYTQYMICQIDLSGGDVKVLYERGAHDSPEFIENLQINDHGDIIFKCRERIEETYGTDEICYLARGATKLNFISSMKNFVSYEPYQRTTGSLMGPYDLRGHISPISEFEINRLRQPVMSASGEVIYICYNSFLCRTDIQGTHDYYLKATGQHSHIGKANKGPISVRGFYPAIDDQGRIFFLCGRSQPDRLLCKLSEDRTQVEIVLPQIDDLEIQNYRLLIDNGRIFFLCNDRPNPYSHRDICVVRADGSGFERYNLGSIGPTFMSDQIKVIPKELELF